MTGGIGLGIDIGTSVVKVVAYDADGRQLSRASRPAPVIRPRPAHSEYDPPVVWSAVVDAVQDVVAHVGTAVERIAATGQGDGCWLLDERGRDVGNAILWNDGRSRDVVSGWEADGRFRLAFDINGSATFPGAQHAILRWLQLHEPQRLDRASVAMFCTGWLTQRLCGAVRTDRTDAGLPWLDIRERSFSERLLKEHDLEWTASLRPQLLDDAQVAGGLTADAAAQLGLEPGIPVVHGPFDAPAMGLGAGVVQPGQALIILGTTLIVESVVDTVDTSGGPSGMTLCTGLDSTWLRLFGTFSGTDSVDWLRRLLKAGSAQDFFDLAGQSPVGSNGLRVLPYFSPAGERAPFVNPAARASVHGLSLDHTSADLARAHLEGLTFALRHCVENMPSTPTDLVLCGGASASPLWAQLITDVIGVPTRSLGGIELGTLGADVMARAATKDAPNLVELASQSAPTGRSHDPDGSRKERYDQMYADFHALRDLAEPGWRLMASR